MMQSSFVGLDYPLYGHILLGIGGFGCRASIVRVLTA